MDPVTTSVIRAIERLGLSGEHILVAVSGGVDSCVLLHALVTCSREHAIRLDVAHINHGLRGDESEADQKAVEAQAVALGLACHVVQVDVPAAREGHVSRTRPTGQEAARNLRYQALDDIANRVGADRIATAHHQGDQAETVLLRLLRGSGTDALSGIPEVGRDGTVVRPLLRVSRADIERYAAQHQIAWREDRSNAEPRYARNRLRHEILPLLADSVNPRVLEALGNVADAHRRDADFLATLVDAEFAIRFRASEENGFEIVKAGWGELHEALAGRLVVRALEQMEARRDVSRVHVERALAFLREGPGAHGGREIELPGGLRLKRLRERFRLYRIDS